jgi:MinD-like ATPase involved in chromosome partitioning or flagellar assembly
VIRDLRSMRAQTETPPSRSLAFARDDIARTTEATRPFVPRPSDRALTIAVTAPRNITCKRGLAAHLAAHLARRVERSGASVCVVDTDLDSRDVGVRFDVAGPTLLDVANDLALRDGRTHVSQLVRRVDPPGLHVLPTRLPQSALVPLLQNKTTPLLARLRAGFDFVVVDTPVSVGLGTYDWERTMLREIDVLLVAVTADPSALGGALRYLNALAAARNQGAVPSTFVAHVVLTGRDDDGSRSVFSDRDIDRRLRGIPVIASVPQLWGRHRPDGPLNLDLQARLDRELSTIVDRLAEDQRDARNR